ncbi:MAG TPA: DUF1553 domain-containing protein [Verrucomicrobiae bacterium]|jgi:hypothetical protein|nr:DUF1553 domain-containing protein [Verrucomicrobiae bacterium]
MDSQVRMKTRGVKGAMFVGFCSAFFAVLIAGGNVFAGSTNVAHWAFQRLVRPGVPESAFSDPIDAFVSATLTKGHHAVAPEADRRTLIRRLSFDLRGLPPSVEEVAAFLNDTRSDAYERLVESFLASPQYGERWGRHWLDMVGYADSNGYFSADSDRPLAWKYRDYVVRAMNANKPLDRFIQEQLAGDELAGYVADGDVTPEMIDPLIATHFWRNAPDGTGESDGNPLEVKVDKYAVIEGNVQIFGTAFLGLTVQCSRCHDHKFEPVKQEEYYGLQAILRPAFELDHWLKPNERVIEVGLRSQREAHKRRTEEVERDLKTLRESLEGLTAPFRRQATEEKLASLNEAVRKEIEKALDTKEKDRNEVMKSLLKKNRALVEVSEETLRKKFPALAAATEPIDQEIKKREADKPAPLERIAATFEPTNRPPAHHLLVRGNHANEGKEIPPMVPAFFHVPFSDGGDSGHEAAGSSVDDSCCTPGAENKRVRSSGRRLALARWVTSPENPIAARVLVNRIWRYHFGQGLVSTSDNLGRSGARPVSPELIDWLASELIQSGWDLKHLHQLIVNSATWKQGSSAVAGDDPAISRAQPERLDAESLRDAMLATSGEIDLALGGSYVSTKTDKEGQVIVDETQPGARRRSIYLQQRRTAPVDFIGTFDGPAHNPVCVQRVSSTVALQSLSLLNSEFVRARAKAFAKRVLNGAEIGSDSGPGNQEAQEKAAMRRAFEFACSRPPTPDELSAAESFIEEQSEAYKGEPDARLHVWTDFCQMILASNSFLYVD